MKAEWRGGLPLPGGSALLCGFYLNELLLKLLAREDAHPALFANYAEALRALAAEQEPRRRRRCCAASSCELLAELGYALALTRDVDTRRADRSRGAVTITHSIAGRARLGADGARAAAAAARWCAARRCSRSPAASIRTPTSRPKRSG